MMFGETPMTPHQARQLNAIELAYIGDCVYECYVRGRLILDGGGRMKALHRAAVDKVNAAAQAAALRRLEPMLTEDERDICRRARNAHTGGIPHNQSAADYHMATALEALIGYLYLSGAEDRLNVIVAEAARSDGVV